MDQLHLRQADLGVGIVYAKDLGDQEKKEDMLLR